MNFSRIFSSSLVFGSLLIFSLGTGCATQATQSEGAQRQREYQQLRKKIVDTHGDFLFGPEKPYLTELAGYSAEIVPGLLSHFSGTYFNADMKEIGIKCQMEPIVCGDARSLEFIFRESHNESVISSRESKLKMIDAWYQGQVSDEALEAALHLELPLNSHRAVAFLK